MAQTEAQAMQQVLMALRTELDATRAQLQTVAQQSDNLKHAHQVLEQQMVAAIQAQTVNADAAIQRLRDHLHTQKMDLLNLQNFKTEAFSGKDGEAWKPWAK